MLPAQPARAQPGLVLLQRADDRYFHEQLGFVSVSFDGEQTNLRADASPKFGQLKVAGIIRVDVAVFHYDPRHSP